MNKRIIAIILLVMATSVTAVRADLFTSRRNTMQSRSYNSAAQRSSSTMQEQRRVIDSRTAGFSAQSSAAFRSGSGAAKQSGTQLSTATDVKTRTGRQSYNYGLRSAGNNAGYNPLDSRSEAQSFSRASNFSLGDNAVQEHRYGRSNEFATSSPMHTATLTIAARQPRSEAVTADEALNQNLPPQQRVQYDPWDGGPDPAPVGDAVPVMALLAAVVAVIKLYRH